MMTTHFVPTPTNLCRISILILFPLLLSISPVKSIKCYFCEGNVGGAEEKAKCKDKIFSCKPTADLCTMHIMDGTFVKACATRADLPPKKAKFQSVLCTSGSSGHCYCDQDGCNTTKGSCGCLAAGDPEADDSDEENAAPPASGD